MQLKFNPRKIESDPKKMYETFSKKIISTAKRNQKVDYSSFYSEIAKLGDSFVKQKKQHEMNNKSLQLAETLVSLNSLNLAGIIVRIGRRYDF